MNPSSLPPGMPAPRRARHGCLVQVLGALVFGVVVLTGVMAIVAPWGFYMGGHFHIIPNWTGWGQMHSKTAGDYALLVSFSPKTGRAPGTDACFRQCRDLHPARRKIQAPPRRRLSKPSRHRSPGQDGASLRQQLLHLQRQHCSVT